jgi:hypothetical protein
LEERRKEERKKEREKKEKERFPLPQMMGLAEHARPSTRDNM